MALSTLQLVQNSFGRLRTVSGGQLSSTQLAQIADAIDTGGSGPNAGGLQNVAQGVASFSSVPTGQPMAWSGNTSFVDPDGLAISNQSIAQARLDASGGGQLVGDTAAGQFIQGVGDYNGFGFQDLLNGGTAQLSDILGGSYDAGDLREALTNFEWNKVSAQYIGSGSGDLRASTEGSFDDSGFNLTELQTALSGDSNYTSVEGIPKSELASMSLANAQEAIAQASFNDNLRNVGFDSEGNLTYGDAAANADYLDNHLFYDSETQSAKYLSDPANAASTDISVGEAFNGANIPPSGIDPVSATNGAISDLTQTAEGAGVDIGSGFGMQDAGAVLNAAGVGLMAYDILTTAATAINQYESGNDVGAAESLLSLEARLVLGLEGAAALSLAFGGPETPLGLAAGVVGGLFGAAGAQVSSQLLFDAFNSLYGAAANQYLTNLLGQNPGAPAGYMSGARSQWGRSMTDPIVLDLDGSGIQLTSLANSSAYFDIHDTGFAVHTGWVGPQTGILVNDPGGNQPITSVAQFFGSDSVDGFTALNSIDSNQDGVLNSSDSSFGDLYVWTDTNGDGVVDSGELHSLADLQISSISLDSAPVDQEINGNVVGAIATFNKTDGTHGTVAEAYLQNDNLNAIYEGSYTLNPDVVELPDLRGYGTAPALAIAMSLDSTLLEMVQAFAEEPIEDFADFESQATAIILRWTGADTVDSSSRGPYVDAQHLVAVENIFGELFLKTFGFSDPEYQPGLVVENVFQSIVHQMEIRLLIQGPFGQYFPSLSYDLTTDNVVGDSSASSFAAELAKVMPTDATDAAQFWADKGGFINQMLNMVSEVTGTTMSSYTDAIQPLLTALDLPFTAEQALSGLFYGTSGSDYLGPVWPVEAVEGAPYFFDGRGDTTGWGDIAQGYGGADTFIYKAGYGHLAIADSGDASKLVLGPGIDELNLTVTAFWNTITLSDGIRGDSIELSGELNHGAVGSIEFSDGTTLTRRDLADITSTGTATNTVLWGSSDADTLDSHGYASVAHGGGGADTFVYDGGYGSLEIEEQGQFDDVVARLEFGPGITESDLHVTSTSDGTGLVITDGIPGDIVTIDYELEMTSPGIVAGVSEVDFSDGSSLTWQQLVALETTGSANNTQLYGTQTADTFDPNGYAHYALGRDGADTFIYKAGYGDLGIDEATNYGAPSTAKLQFDSSVAASDLVVSLDRDGDLIIADGTPGDRIVIDRTVHEDSSGVAEVDFSDGSVLTREQLLNMLPAVGAPGVEGLSGTSGTDSFDTASYASYIWGGGGADTITYNAGYGAVEIDEREGTNGSPLADSSAVLQFGPGISLSSISASSNSSGDIILTDGVSGDKIVLDSEMVAGYDDWSTYLPNGVGEIEFANGTTLTRQELFDLAVKGSSTNVYLYGSATSETFDPNGYATHALGNGGNDTFLYNEGYGLVEVDEQQTSGDASVKLGGGISLASLKINSNAEGDILLTDGIAGDQLVLDGQMSGSGVDELDFEDGTSISREDLLSLATTGSPSNTSIYGLTYGPASIDPAGYAHKVVGRGYADVITYQAGYGQLEVNEQTRYGSSQATIEFGAGITAADITVSRDMNDNLVLTDGVAGDRILVDLGLSGQVTHGLQRVDFSDGTSLSRSDLAAMTATVGSADNTSLHGTAGADVFDFNGFARFVNGEGGADTFNYDRNDGVLEIDDDAGSETDSAAVLHLGSGIQLSDLSFSGDSSGNVIITDGTSGDQLTINSEASLSFDWDEEGNVSASFSNTGVGGIEFSDGTTISHQDIIDLMTTGTANNTRLYGSWGDDSFDLHGYASYEVGEGGADSFIYNAGYGALEINEDNSNIGVDSEAILQFGAGITSADLTMTSDASGNLILTDGTSGDVVTIDGQFHETWSGAHENGVAQIEFSDGTSLDRQDLLTAVTQGSPANTALYGDNDANSFDPHGYATSANGGGGADTFIYNSGDGAFEIAAQDGSTLELGAGIAPEDVKATIDQSGDVILLDGVSGDRITLDGELSAAVDGDADSGVATVTFSDGTVWTQSDLLAQLSTVGSTANTGLYGTTGADTFDPEGVATYLAGNGGADTVIYDRGYGSLTIDEDNGSSPSSAKLLLGAGIAETDIAVSTGADGTLTLFDGTSGDRIALVKQIEDSEYGVGEVDFADGSVLTRQQLLSMADTGSPTNTLLMGTTGADLFDSHGYATSIEGGGGEGGGGDDTIVYNSGYGQLSIDELSYSPATTKLEFGAGISISDISVNNVVSGSDDNANMVITDGVTGDEISISIAWATGQYGYFGGIDEIDFSDGASLSRQNLLTLATTGAPGKTHLYGSEATETFDSMGYSTYEAGGQGDTFVYKLGYGNLEINVNLYLENSSADLQFGSGIDPSQITLANDAAGDVLLYDGQTGDRIVIDGMLIRGDFGLHNSGVGSIGFSDGAVWSYNQIESYLSASNGGLSLYSGGGNRVLDVNNVSSPMTLNLGAGITADDVDSQTDGNGNLVVSLKNSSDSVTFANDLVDNADGATSVISRLLFSDGTSSDLIVGNSESNNLTGTAGNDIIDGRGGDDSVTGGGGDDVYKFGQGYGQLAIDNTGGTAPHGLLDFASGLSPEDIWFKEDGDNLLIQRIGCSDQVTVDGWFGSDASAKTASIAIDGSVGIDSQLNALIAAMATFTDDHPGFDPALASSMPPDTVLQAQIAASWHA